MFCVNNPDATSAGDAFYTEGQDAAGKLMYLSTEYSMRSFGSLNVYGQGSVGQALATFTFASGGNVSDLDFFKNGTPHAGTLTADTVMDIGTTAKATIGSKANGANPYDGQINEIIVYASDQSANRAGIETNINAAYSIY